MNISNNYNNKFIIWNPNVNIYILFFWFLFFYLKKIVGFNFFFLNYPYTRGQLNQNSILIDRSNQAEQERSELQRSLIQTSSQYEQLSSENRGLTIALDELRRTIF